MATKSKVSLIIFILLISSGARAQWVYDGVILDHANRWDGYPVHRLVSGVHHIWFCAQSLTNQGHFDAVSVRSLRVPAVWIDDVMVYEADGVPTSARWQTHVELAPKRASYWQVSIPEGIFPPPALVFSQRATTQSNQQLRLAPSPLGDMHLAAEKNPDRSACGI